ncbi:glycosyl transferase family 2 [Gloeothece citriformis PCC 7424]|uniref:Glycosyl transferase family 2 n=1 Tax=Gloeothece citriformis (strain PCC 7424) TaxID=65393 RepID=B7K7D0_GLOC7|nr:glycosyltransferase family 2 protein [Gloeothece citriformis]ACK69698.1 glycosyl transferase family 2 [Gloeothece citriformis PCC 7424]
MIQIHPFIKIFEKTSDLTSQVTVCISLYNYRNYILETLDSVYNQTLDLLDLIVVDDCSKDDSLTVTLSWLEKNSQRFNKAQLVQHQTNNGLAYSRNTAIGLAQTPYVFILDADNLLYPRCIMQGLEALESSKAAFAYSIIEKFGAMEKIIGNQSWSKEQLAYGNYIDAMALIKKTSLEAVDGYSHIQYGWEDYDLWCKFAEKNFYGILVPEILVRYRVHPESMTKTTTQQKIESISKELKKRHPWLKTYINSI